MNNLSNFGQYFASIQSNMFLLSNRIQEIEAQVKDLSNQFEALQKDRSQTTSAITSPVEPVDNDLATRVFKLEESIRALDSIFSQINVGSNQVVDEVPPVDLSAITTGKALKLDDDAVVSEEVTNDGVIVGTTTPSSVAKKRTTKKK